MEENVANDHGSEELTIEYPLSPELNTARIKKKRKRTRKSLNLSVLGLNSDYVTNGSFRVSQESSSNDGSSVFSNNHEMLGKTSYTTLKKDYEALSEASLNEISRTTNNDVLQMLIRDQDKNVIGDQDNKLTSELNCSNTDNTLKKDGGLLDLEKSPILSTNTLKKDGGLLDLEKSPILSTNTLKKDGGLLYLEKSPILSTNTLKKDGGLLDLEKSPILSTNTLKKDGGLLDLKKSPILSTNTLKKDGGLLDFEKSPILITNTLKKDGGLLDLEKSPILSTNTLKKDGGLLDLEKSPILSTNTLKKDGGLLDLEKSPILSTKTLKKDGGLLDLEKSPILSTNTLKKDGGLLDLEKSPILTTKTLKKDEGLLEFEKSPILSNNPLNKDGRLPDLEKSPILNSNCHIKKYRRLKKRKILNDTNVNDEYANVSKSNHLQKNESQCRDSNMLPNEFSDLSFSILEEICQTTELSFNRDKDDLKSSNDDDLSKIKSASVLCGKLSSNLGKKEKKSVCDKLVTTNFKVIERDNNSDVTSRIVIDSNDSDRRCGSIYISNSIRERKPIANSGSISTLLESAKLLDDSESVSYLEETKKQKDFKLMCRKEKLNDGSYICFESISKGNYKNDNHDRGASKIRGRNDNKVLFDKSSLMDKYNIDMNNTLNISSQQFDDLISCAEKLNSSEKTKVGINSRLEMNSKSSIEFHEQQKTLNEIKTGLLRYCPSNGLSEEESCKPTIPANSSKKIPHFQKLETNKSMLSEKGNRNATIPSKLSKIMRNEAHTRNDPIESETLVKSVETDNVDKLLQEWVFKKDREALICEKDNTTSAKCFEQRMTSEQSKLELGLVGSASRRFSTVSEDPTSEESLINDEILFPKNDCTAYTTFSTANGKSISVSKVALSKANALLTENECNHTASSTGKEELNALFDDFKGETIGMSKNILIKTSTLSYNNCNSKYANEVPISTENPIKVSEKLLVRERTHSARKESCHPDIPELSTTELESSNLEGLPRNGSTLFKKIYSNEHKFSGFSTARGKSIRVSEEALIKARTLLSEKENFDTNLTELPTDERKSILPSEETHSKTNTLLHEKESDEIAYCGFSTAKGKSIPVSDEALAKAKQLLHEETSDENTFCGFSTAKGKSIPVSDKALSKAKQLLYEETDDGNTFCGFSTAKGKSIPVSDEALSKAKPLLHEETSDGNVFCGFSTAKGKSIPVSDEALSKAKQLLYEEPDDGNTFCGFSTAKGKSIPVSDEALSKAKQLLHEETSDGNVFCGFSTAKGKSIPVSDEALSKAKQLLHEETSDGNVFCGFSTAKRKSIPDSDEALSEAKHLLHEETSDGNVFCGFSTAKGKSIPVSDEALSKAKQLLHEETSDGNVFCGFSTAKGKSIPVSDEALSKAKQLLHEETSDGNVFCGFSTAKGKSIPVSDEAIVKAKQLLHEETSDENTFCGYSTAKGKLIKFSDKALAKARTLLHEETSEGNAFFGFSTAKGKSIPVSEEALAKAKTHLYENEYDEDAFLSYSTAKDESVLVSNKPSVKAKTCFQDNKSFGDEICGFSTVEGQSIVTSVEPLAKARILLSDEDEKLNTCNESILDNENHKVDTISEQLSLEDSCINKHFLSQSPDKYKPSPNRHSQFYEDMPCLSLSFVDEVSESTAAFLADEDVPEFKDPPVWLRTFVTSPSFVQDRSEALSPILCTDSEIKMRKKRACSPVLGVGDRFKIRKKRLKFSKSKLDENQVAGCSTPIMNSKLKKNQEDPYNNFIDNLKTSTPISINRTKIKRTIQIDEPNCACEKKLKMMDSWDDDSQVDQTIFYQLDVIEGRRKATENQELLLKNGKDKSLTKMQKGALFVKRQLGQRIPLRSLVKSPRTLLSTAQLIGEGIKQSVIGINYENAAEFRFSSSNSLSKYICESNCDGIPVGDNALVILSDDGSAGLKEISRAFLASPGIDPTLISHEWIANHFRSIVWKLASTERNFPHLLAGSYLTLDNVLLQLRYRYDREIDDCQRSCLRKILETDESAARRMVLCVSEILVNKSSATKELKLTDGWYRINASVDEEMMCLIDRGKVAVGTKLVVQGCELLNCEQGHDPLHVPNTVQLKLHTNCARRARWDCRLGFCQTQGPILVGKLKDVLPKGGNIGRIDVLVVRVYPLVYMLKTEDGKSVVYSKKREEQECLLNERRMTELIEKLQSQVQREMDEMRNRKSNSNQDEESLPSQDLVESGQIPTRDQMRIMTNLREQKQRKYQEILRQKLDEKMSENCPEKRKSIPMLKVRVIDARASNEDKNSTLQTAMLTVWKPTEDVENVLVEGNTISLYSVTAHGKRSGELQLSTGRQTKYSVGAKSEAFSRKCHFLCDISRSLNPLFSEINTVGLVVHVENSSTSVETAYLTDDQNNYLGVRFWGGIKKYGWQSCVCVGSEISCSNLEWRSTVSRSNVPYVFVTELSVFSSNPRSKYLQNALDQFKNSIKRMDMKELLSKSKEHLLDMLNGGGTGNYICDSFSKMSSVSVSGETSAITPSNKNLLAESPLSSVKSKMLMEKMQKLLGYGNPPAITAMPSLQVSPALKKDFKTPNRKSL